jgi:uncharacterized surface protein with fasciclin (FAS1) repeats
MRSIREAKGEFGMNKVVITLFVSLTLILAACGPAAPTPEVIEATQAPSQTPEVVVEPTAEPTQAPTNTPEPTAIPPTPTEEPEAEPEVFISSGVTQADLADELTIYEVLQANQETLTLGQFLADTTLGGLFFDFTDGSQPLTILAPQYKFEDTKDLFPSVDQYKVALTYHVVPGLYLEADLADLDGQSIPTRMEGKVINITVKDGVVYLNDAAMVIKADILAENGIIHVIDQFLVPPAE